MKNKILTFSLMLSFFLQFSAFAGRSRNDNFLRTYPDGSMGIDIGGGYEVAPVGKGGREKLLMPEGYRDNFVNTRFGPMTQKGFSFYPDFKFSDTQRKEDKAKKKVEEEKKEKDYIFQVTGEATTNAPEMSPIWGVYIPPKKSE